ncbi:succinylglutamate desuccinylase/aspartoacylase family protein [Mariniblastus fucicola]|uniref:Succinylglutamate desuccinylase / Aspartoacylase family protein n=1 Tax=Mariniblastus fucicola TaxID=980251 RepID=A0A5B9PAJ7_9BACT|nr:succinylglutamate desuccinylase/aspartoacylase family protein [Mariniblastus fucicola]QEG23797.1 Succinylglutamate desuccinylase / Aspartoacylase family protein [Mariniblastus fucicola]
MNEFSEPPVTNGYENVKHVKRVDNLEIESLPSGEFSRLFIEIVENGIGRPIQVPVVVARGKKDGPIMGVTAALHGNELNGIPVIHKLLQRLNLKTLRGSIVCAIGANMPGLLTERREFTDGQDLNHIMPGKPNGKISQVYAYNLVDRITQHFDYLIDLHTASEGRVNSLYVRADLKQETTAQMAYLLRPQIIVHNPPSDYTLRGTAAEAGKPAITVEICDPQKFQRDPIARTVKGIRRILNHIDMVPSKSASQSSATKPPILCRKSYWVLAERGGMMRCVPKIAERFKKGDLIATQVSIFGDTIKEYFAPEDGIAIGHCVNPIGQTGARILHLGVPMDERERAKFEKISGCSLDGTLCELPTGKKS